MSSNKANPTRSAETTSNRYRLVTIDVEDARSESSAAYEYSDLKRSGLALTVVVMHVLYWPVYTLLFPYQYLYRAIKFRFWTNDSPADRLRFTIANVRENMQKFKFLRQSDRFVLYLRASRLFTPAQLFPFLPGNAPIRESSSNETSPLPDDWDVRRRAVYQRDNYQCVNCGAAGEPHGSHELHADHVVPRSRGGPDDLVNLRTLCRECHEARHATIFD